MKEINHGAIIFNKITKCFIGRDGYDVDNMSDACLFGSVKKAEFELQSIFDCPENFEVWKVEITIETV